MGALANALMAHGYNETDARNAENGPRAAELSREYLGNSGGGGGGGATDANSILSQAISAITGLVPKSVKPYDEVNPFFFDEQLARAASTAEYEPYYKEMLTDYTTKVEQTKTRSEQDFQRTLEQLNAGKEYYMGTQRRLLDKALTNVNEGYAGRGLFFSGAKTKDIGELNTEYQAETKNYMTNFDYSKTGAQLAKERALQDVNLEQKNYTRDVEREKKAAIESGVLTRRGEAMDEYNAGMKKYYSNAGYSGLLNYA